MDKNKLFLSVSVAVLLVSMAIFFFVSKKIDTYRDISNIIDYNQVNFAGEKVSFDGKYYFNREKFEREIAITRFNVYQFILYHKREPLYIPKIEKKLHDAWIPDDFKYLAIAESGLRNDSLSSAGAWGIWQFVSDTARQYGLKITDQVDERYDFDKSTDAALQYLTRIHKDLGDWTLTAAAYNRWENGIKRALDDQKVTSYYDLYLNEETSRYLFRILAIKYLMENRYKIFDAHDLGEVFVEPRTKYIPVTEVSDLQSWCRDNNYDYVTTRQLNQWILWTSLPKGNWSIKILDL